MSTNRELRKLLHNSTARLEVGEQHGTGFFVAPGLVLTCAHVIKPAVKDGLSVRILHDNQTFDPKPFLSTEIFLEDYPDLALLRLEFTDHPCVLLGSDFEAFIDLYSYGYTFDHPEEKFLQQWNAREVGKLIKLKDGQVKPGSSGSPLLNEDTGNVCGMMKLTRDRMTDLGGAGIPISTVFEYFPNLEKQNRAFHDKDHRWIDLLEKKELGKISSAVAALIYTEPGKISKPKQFVGRNDILTQGQIFAGSVRAGCLDWYGRDWENNHCTGCGG